MNDAPQGRIPYWTTVLVAILISVLSGAAVQMVNAAMWSARLEARLVDLEGHVKQLIDGNAALEPKIESRLNSLEISFAIARRLLFDVRDRVDTLHDKLNVETERRSRDHQKKEGYGARDF